MNLRRRRRMSGHISCRLNETLVAIRPPHSWPKQSVLQPCPKTFSDNTHPHCLLTNQNLTTSTRMDGCRSFTSTSLFGVAIAARKKSGRQRIRSGTTRKRKRMPMQQRLDVTIVAKRARQRRRRVADVPDRVLHLTAASRSCSYQASRHRRLACNDWRRRYMRILLGPILFVMNGAPANIWGALPLLSFCSRLLLCSPSKGEPGRPSFPSWY